MMWSFNKPYKMFAKWNRDDCVPYRLLWLMTDGSPGVVSSCVGALERVRRGTSLEYLSAVWALLDHGRYLFVGVVASSLLFKIIDIISLVPFFFQIVSPVTISSQQYSINNPQSLFQFQRSYVFEDVIASLWITWRAPMSDAFTFKRPTPEEV